MVVFTAIDHYAPIVEHILSLASGAGRHAFMIHLDDILATSQRIARSHTAWTLCIISNKSAVWRRIKSLIAHNDAVAESELIVALALCRRGKATFCLDRAHFSLDKAPYGRCGSTADVNGMLHRP